MNDGSHNSISIPFPKGKKIFWASDFHLGAPNKEESRKRERYLVQWMDEVAPDAAHLFLVGDLFDFWYEYKNVIPKGYTRFLGKLAEWTDNGIGITAFSGNHDMWLNDYFREELGVEIFHRPQKFEIAQKIFLVAHGDGLGPGDKGYKRLKRFLRNKWTQNFFSVIPSAWSLPLADKISKSSRNLTTENEFLGEEKEWLVQYSRGILESQEIDYFVFGHRHLPMDFSLNKTSRMINLGDWISHFTYAVFDGENMELKEYETVKQ